MLLVLALFLPFGKLRFAVADSHSHSTSGATVIRLKALILAFIDAEQLTLESSS